MCVAVGQFAQHNAHNWNSDINLLEITFSVKLLNLTCVPVIELQLQVATWFTTPE